MTQRRSIAPIFWLLFGAGGMLAAFFGPPLLIISGFLVPFPDFASAISFARSPLGKLVLLIIITLFVWHGAERLYLTLRDMRVGPTWLLQLFSYGGAAVVSLFTIVLLLQIGF
jgi:fumarate reductase subunit D